VIVLAVSAGYFDIRLYSK